MLSLHGKMQSHARPEQWAREQIDLLAADISDLAESPWGDEILSHARRISNYWVTELDRLMADALMEAKIAAAYLPSLTETAEAVRELDRCLRISWDRARECFPIPFNRLGALRNSPDTLLSERIKLRRDGCKKAMASILLTRPTCGKCCPFNKMHL